MSILIDKSTRVLVQGLGKAGTFHAKGCRDYGTQIVGAVKPGKGGTTQEGFPLFDTVAQAVAKTGASVLSRAMSFTTGALGTAKWIVRSSRAASSVSPQPSQHVAIAA